MEYLVYLDHVGSCESFVLRSNLESNRPSDSIPNGIFESNRPYIPASSFSRLTTDRQLDSFFHEADM